MGSHWDYLLPFVFLLALAMNVVSGMSCAYDNEPFMYSDMILGCETGLQNASCFVVTSETATGSYVGLYPGASAFNGTGAVFTDMGGNVVFPLPVTDGYYEGLNYSWDAVCVLANGTSENQTGTFIPGQPRVPSWLGTWLQWMITNSGFVILFILGIAVLLFLLVLMYGLLRR